MRVLAIVPAYNEAPNLPAVVGALLHRGGAVARECSALRAELQLVQRAVRRKIEG